MINEQIPEVPIQSQETIQPVSETPVLPKKKFNFKIIAILLIVILLITGGVYARMQIGKRQMAGGLQPKATPTLIPQPTQIPTLIPTPDETANWKIYTNSLLSYSVKYPQNWLLLDLTEGKQIEIYYQPDKTKSVGEILIEEIDDSSYNRELGSKQATKGILIGDSNAKCKTDDVEKTWCYLTFNSKYLSILIVKEKDQEYNKIIDQILSSFKFLD